MGGGLEDWVECTGRRECAREDQVGCVVEDISRGQGGGRTG